MLKKTTKLCLFWLLTGYTLSAVASPFTEQTIYTDSWPPYVNAEGEPPGVVSAIVEKVIWEMEYKPKQRYISFDLAIDLVRQKKIMIAYPYFKTGDRQDMSFSYPIMKVKNAFFYSVQHNGDFAQKAQSPQDLKNLDIKVGKVRGYAYGAKLQEYLSKVEEVDKQRDQQGRPRRLHEYTSEVLALKALLNHQIDLLPMAIKTFEALMLKHYPWRYPELKQLPGIVSEDYVYVVVQDSDAGEAFINEFNRILKKIQKSAYVDEAMEVMLDRTDRSGYVRLVANEGHPVVIGQTQADPEQSEFYMIPQGTRALVLQWSSEVTQSHDNENFFNAMKALTKVRVVDGPHAGKAFFVRNLYIEIE